MQLRSVTLIVILFLESTLAFQRQGYAAPTGDSEALIQEGLELRRKGDDKRALERFLLAASLHRSGRVLAQIALAEQALGQWVDAEVHLNEALAWRHEAWIAKKRPLLESALADISSHLGTLELLGNVAGATVKINGVVRGRLPLAAPLRVPSGTATVELEAEGYFPLARGVVVLSAGRAHETLNMVPATSNEPIIQPLAPLPNTVAALPGEDVRLEQSKPMPAPSSWQRTAAWVSLAASGALLVYGGIYNLKREGAVSDAAAGGCTQRNGLCPNLSKELAPYESKMALGYGGAAALAATSGVLFWLAPASSTTQDVGFSLHLRSSF